MNKSEKLTEMLISDMLRYGPSLIEAHLYMPGCLHAPFGIWSKLCELDSICCLWHCCVHSKNNTISPMYAMLTMSMSTALFLPIVISPPKCIMKS